ncbi:hypothetical protein IQ231_19360 [Cuspidothrix issatschenkoi LEGE 03284]|jgi:hypothetical protein|uniref:hypothetical protein n=1 Tax=Cuspidothrix issatschenkoi TaxID=230752 RepID=UPI00187EF22D|nr:hypothetical protein [Cuspidothrix issatschenkoi]MBE9233767.1 hypothetical protein [Cuspidothrix issatschenkoi LEGE 03284]
MTHTERNRIKQLLKNTFWQFEDESDFDITPKLVRQFAQSQLHPDVIEATAINLSGRGFWTRVEKLCNLTLHARHWINLTK